jgi:hypothetical protein
MNTQTYSLRSILFGIIGLFIWPLSPIAIHYGNKAKQNDHTDSYAKVGSILGWMGVILLVLAAVCYGGIVLILNILFEGMGSF